MEQSKKKKFLFVLGPTILFITLIGFTYAFFNYTRTGAANNLGTGTIYFNTTEGPTLNLTNIFPMTSEDAGEANLDSLTVGIEGNTTYADGEEYEITLVDVTNTINGKSIPMNYIATYTATTGNTIGTSSDDYWNARNSKDATIYQLNATGSVEEDTQILVGYIDNGATGINGTLTIKAYIDADRIAISDTYYENATATPTPTVPTDEYGTTTEWVDNRVVLTTEEWNSLRTTPISFKIKAESNEGIWVKEPSNGTIELCPDCKFTYFVANSMSDAKWTTWNTNSQTPTQITSGLYDSYDELIATTGKNYFLGVKLNSNNEVTNAYACGVKDGTPFCIEGYSDNSKYNANKTLLNGANLYNNTCTETLEDEGTENEYRYSECGPWDNSGSVSANANSNGGVYAGVSDVNDCYVLSDGEVGCFEHGGEE